MTASELLRAFHRKLRLSYNQLCDLYDLPYETIRRAERGKPILAREWHKIEVAILEYATPERLEERGLPQDALEDLVEQLPFAWKEAADRELNEQREAA